MDEEEEDYENDQDGEEEVGEDEEVRITSAIISYQFDLKKTN